MTEYQWALKSSINQNKVNVTFPDDIFLSETIRIHSDEVNAP